MITKLTKTEAECFLNTLMNPSAEIKEARLRFARDAEAVQIDGLTIYSKNIDAEAIELAIRKRDNITI